MYTCIDEVTFKKFKQHFMHVEGSVLDDQFNMHGKSKYHQHREHKRSLRRI